MGHRLQKGGKQQAQRPLAPQGVAGPFLQIVQGQVRQQLQGLLAGMGAHAPQGEDPVKAEFPQSGHCLPEEGGGHLEAQDGGLPAAGAQLVELIGVEQEQLPGPRGVGALGRGEDHAAAEHIVELKIPVQMGRAVGHRHHEEVYVSPLGMLDHFKFVCHAALLLSRAWPAFLLPDFPVSAGKMAFFLL